MILEIYNEVNTESNINTEDDLVESIKSMSMLSKGKDHLQQKLTEMESSHTATLDKMQRVTSELKSTVLEKEQLSTTHKQAQLEIERLKCEIKDKLLQINSKDEEMKELIFQHSLQLSRCEATISRCEGTIEENQSTMNEMKIVIADYKAYISKCTKKKSKHVQPAMDDTIDVRPKQPPVEGESKDRVLSRPVSFKPIPAPRRSVTPSVDNLSDVRRTKSMVLDETKTLTSYSLPTISKSLEVKPSTDSKELFTFMRKTPGSIIDSFYYLLTASYFDPNELSAHAVFKNTGDDFKARHRVLSCIDKDIADANYVSFAYMYSIQGITPYTVADAYFKRSKWRGGYDYIYHRNAKSLASKIIKVLEECKLENVMFCLAIKHTGERAILNPTDSTDDSVKNLTFQLITELVESGVL